jgi:hypothetical protein
MKMMVFCTLEREKVHKWDGAAKFEEVKYLASLHRHVFHFRVEVEVSDDDREIEFIMLKHKLEAIVDAWGYEVGSCEMMARSLMTHLRKWYAHESQFSDIHSRHFRVEVSEDGENGAVIEE